MKMFLDDIREPKNDYDVIVRSFEEAIIFVKNNGIPNFISFDHDLGSDNMGNVLKDGYDFAKWLVDMDIKNIHKFFKDDFNLCNVSFDSNDNYISKDPYVSLKYTPAKSDFKALGISENYFLKNGNLFQNI